MSAKMRTWRRVSEDYEKRTGKKMTPQAAKKISIRAERKLRRGLIDLAFELGILTEDDVTILKQAIYSQNDHILCSRRSRPRRLEDRDADLQQEERIHVQQHGGRGGSAEQDVAEFGGDLCEEELPGPDLGYSSDSDDAISDPPSRNTLSFWKARTPA